MAALRIAIFASGSGSNAEAIIQYLKNSEIAKVALIVSNNPKAYVIERAKDHGISSYITTKDEFYESQSLLKKLEKDKIDIIVLAGFLLLIPIYLIEAFPYRIINIHPALLPKYGGKGMYGSHVHRAVCENQEKESGISIHYIDENYDRGQIIFQKSIGLDPEDTPEIIAEKVLKLEHYYYPRIIEQEAVKLKQQH